MKKLLVLMSALLFVFAFAACSDDDPVTPPTSSSSATSSSNGTTSSTSSTSSTDATVTIADLRAILDARVTAGTDSNAVGTNADYVFSSGNQTVYGTVAGIRATDNKTIHITDANGLMFTVYSATASTNVVGDVIKVTFSVIQNYYALYEIKGSLSWYKTGTATVAKKSITSAQVADFGKWLKWDGIVNPASWASSSTITIGTNTLRNQTGTPIAAGTYNTEGYVGYRSGAFMYFIDDNDNVKVP